MAWVTIDGTEYIFPTGQFRRGKPIRIGTVRRAYSGASRSQVRGEKRTWEGTPIPLTDAELATLEASLASGRVVVLAGDCVSAPVNVRGSIDRVIDIVDPSDDTNVLHTVDIALEEA